MTVAVQMPSYALDIGHLAQIVVQNPAIEVGSRRPEDIFAADSGTRIDIGWAGFSGMKVLILAVSMVH